MKRLVQFMLVVATAWSANAQSVTNSYTMKFLVSDLAGVATTQDTRLVNPWGLSRPANASLSENEWWAADNLTGVSTLYDANGTITPLAVTIPSATGTGTGSPTGTVAVGGNFYFVTLDGTISEWLATTLPSAPGTPHPSAAAGTCDSCHVTTATVRVNNSSSLASYSGITVALHNSKPTLYVANGWAAGAVEAYDASTFARISLPSGAFTDSMIPAGYVPNGIQAIGNKIYVAFAPNSNAAVGAVDAFDTNGNLLLRMQNGVWFNQPWGIAQAPSNFGFFSNALLVGNTGSGTIMAFSPTTGTFLGVLHNSSGKPIALPGLWGISFGNGNTQSGPTNTLYFNTGLKNTNHGIFGAITAN